MAYPVVYDQTYSYTGFSASLGDGSFPGTQLDADMAGLSDAQASLLAFMQATFRSDGVLQVSALPQAEDLAAFVSQAEAAATAAAASATAADGSKTAAAGSATAAAGSATAASGSATAASGSETAAAASAVAAAASAAAPANNSVATATIQNLAVTTGKIADGALSADTTGRAKMADGFLTTAKLADNAVTAAKADVGMVVQVANVMVGAMSTTTTLIPADDTIPQITEGAEFMTLAITPKSATNKLKIEVVLHASNSVAGDFVTAALFQDSTANALAAGLERSDSAGGKAVTFTHFMTAGSTSAMTFRVRAGGNAAGTVTFNGSAGARRMGGVMASSITITEIKA